MNLKKLIVVFVAAASGISQISAFEPLSIFPGHSKCWPDCVGKFCCDDYCAKPLPCLPVGKMGFACDDYCRQPLPCPPFGKTGFCCDDYCRKPQPPPCFAGGKDLHCIPNRLPPLEAYVPNKTTAALSEPEADDAEVNGVEVLSVSSSRRVYNSRDFDAN